MPLHNQTEFYTILIEGKQFPLSSHLVLLKTNNHTTLFYADLTQVPANALRSTFSQIQTH